MPTIEEKVAQSLARERAGLPNDIESRVARSLRMDKVKRSNPGFEYTTDVEAPVLPEDQEQGVARRVAGSFAKGAFAIIPAAQRALATANEFLSPIEGPLAEKIGLPKPGEVMRGRARMTENVIDTALPEAPNRTFMTNTLPSAVGSVVPMLLSGGAAAGPVAVGAIQGYGAGEREADEAGAGSGGRFVSGALNAALGASEGLLGAGKLAGSVMNRTGARLGTGALRTAGGEALQEAGQQLGSNIVARDLVGYDPNRGRFSGVGESALAGGLVGGGVHGLARGLDAARDRMSVSLDPDAFRGAGDAMIPRAPSADQVRDYGDGRIAQILDDVQRQDAFWADELARAGVRQPPTMPDATPRPIERLRAQRRGDAEIGDIIGAADAETRARDAAIAEAADRASYREASGQMRRDRVAGMEEAARVPRAEPTEDELAALFADIEGREEFRDPRPMRGELPRPGETEFDQMLAALRAEREGRPGAIQGPPVSGYPSQGENMPPYYSFEDIPALFRGEEPMEGPAPPRRPVPMPEESPIDVEAIPLSARSVDEQIAAAVQGGRRKPPGPRAKPPKGKRPPEGGDEGGAPPAAPPTPPPTPKGPAPVGGVVPQRPRVPPPAPEVPAPITARAPASSPAPAPQPPAPTRAGLPPVEGEGRPGATLGPGGLMKTPRGGFTFTASLRGTDPSPAPTHPKPSVVEARRATTGDPQRDAKLSEMRESIARRKAEGKGPPIGFNDRMFAYYEKLEASDPSKWKPGDGVSYRVGQMLAPGSQMNRGFRIVEVDPATKMAKVRQVADTGITVSGGDDRLSDAWVHVASLARDNKYNAPTTAAPDATVRPPAPPAKPARESVPDFMRAEVVPPQPKGPALSGQRDFAMGMQPPTLETGANPDADPNTPDMFSGKKPPPPPAKRAPAPKSAAKQGSLLGEAPKFKKSAPVPFAQREHVSWGEVTKQIAGQNRKIPLSKEVAGELQHAGFFDEFGHGSGYTRGKAGGVAKMTGEASRYFYITDPTSQEFGGPTHGGRSGTVAGGHSDLSAFIPFLEKIGARDSQGNPITDGADNPDILYALQEYSPRGTATFDPDSPQNVEAQEAQAYERDVADGFEGTREEWRESIRREIEAMESRRSSEPYEEVFSGVPLTGKSVKRASKWSAQKLGVGLEKIARAASGRGSVAGPVGRWGQALQRNLVTPLVGRIESQGNVGKAVADKFRQLNTTRETIQRSVAPRFNEINAFLSTKGGARARADLSKVNDAYKSRANVGDVRLSDLLFTNAQVADKGQSLPGEQGRLLKMVTGLTHAIGTEAQRRGVVFDENGEPFQPRESIWLRQITPEYREFMSNPNDPEYRDYIAALAMQNNMKPKDAAEAASKIYKDLILGEKSQGPQSAIKQAAFEHKRVFPESPAFWRNKDGSLTQLFEADAKRYVDRVYSGQISRLAVLSEFGQTTTGGVPLGPEGANNQLLDIMNDAEKELRGDDLRAFTRDFREALAAASEVDLESHLGFGDPLHGTTPIGEELAGAYRVMRTLKLSGAQVRNLVQTLHFGPTIAGPVNFARALGRVIASPRGSMEAAEAAGAILTTVRNSNWKPFVEKGHAARDISADVSDRIMRGTGFTLTERLNNAIGFEMGRLMADQIRAGKFSDPAALEVLEYSAPERAALMSKNPPKELLDGLGARVARTINYTQMGGEQMSRAQHSKWFRAIAPFNTFIQQTWHRQARVLEANARGLQSNDGATQIRAARNIFTSMIGAPAAGAIGSYLVAAVAGNWRDTDETKAAKDILAKLGEGEVGAAALGTMGEMAKASFDYYMSPVANMADYFDPQKPLESVGTSLSLPLSFIVEAARGVQGSGQYADEDLLERTWRFAQFSAPVMKRGQRLFTAVAGMRDPELDKSISRFYDWQRQQPNARAIRDPEPGYDPFRRHMRRAADALKIGDVRSARINVREAIRSDRPMARDERREPRSPAASLRARKMLDKLSPQERRKFMQDVGAVDFQRLRTYDRMLEFMAENAE